MRSILYFLLFCGLAWGQSVADDLFKDALTAVQKGDLAKAEFLLREMRLEAPKDIRWATNLVSVLIAQNRTQEALKLARENVQQFANAPAPHLELGSLLVKMGQFDEALQEYEKTLEFADSTGWKAVAYSMIGEAHGRAGNVDESISAYRKAKEVSGVANATLAGLLVATGNVDEGIAEYRAVLRADPNHAGALNDLAYAWAERGENLDQALQYARRAVELRPNITHATDTLAWVYFKKGMLVDAEETMVRAIRQEGGAAPTQRDHLALVMDARNQWTPERRELRKLLEGELSAGQLARMKELVSK